MPRLTLTLNAKPQKWGLVTVLNPDGTLNRQFKITEAAYRALALPDAGPPPTVTKEEWESGRARASGKDYDVGDLAVLPNGDLRAKLWEGVVNGEIREVFVRAKAGTFSGVPPLVTLESADVTSINTLQTQIRITSIQDGVVTWQSR